MRGHPPSSSLSVRLPSIFFVLSLLAVNAVGLSRADMATAHGTFTPVIIHNSAQRLCQQATLATLRRLFGTSAPVPALRVLSCAINDLRARRWAALYTASAPSYQQRYGLAQITATVSPTATVSTITRPPDYSRTLFGWQNMAGFWGGSAIVPLFATQRLGALEHILTLYAVQQDMRWSLVIAPPLACTLQTGVRGPFSCAISLALSDQMGSYSFLVDGYGAGNGGLLRNQYAVIGSSMPWQLGPGDHTIALQSASGGWTSPVVATAAITIPGAPPTPSTICPAPTLNAPTQNDSGPRLHVSGGFPGGAVHVTFATTAFTGTWDAFEVDLDGGGNGNDPGTPLGGVSVQLPLGIAPGWHTISIIREMRPDPGSPPVLRTTVASVEFMVYAPGNCQLPADSTRSS